MPRASVKTLLVFCGLGPLFGALPYFVLFLHSATAPIFAFFFVSFFAYVLGLVPSLMAGLTFLLASHQANGVLNALPLRLKGAFLGGISGCASTSFFMLLLGAFNFGNEKPVFWLFIALGAFSGSLCGAISIASNTPLNPDAPPNIGAPAS